MVAPLMRVLESMMFVEDPSTMVVLLSRAVAVASEEDEKAAATMEKVGARVRVKVPLKVLKAFVHGDGNLFNSYPELEEAQVWVYFHSNIPEFNKVECWGPLKDAAAPSSIGVNGTHEDNRQEDLSSNREMIIMPRPCQEDCTCCFPPISMMIPWPHDLPPAGDS